MNLSPVIQKNVFEYHSVWKEERESRSFVSHHKESQFFSEFSVITFFRFFQHVQIFFQLCFFRECSSVDSLQHFIFLASSPVCTCKACELKCFDIFCTHQVRTCTQICKLSLRIEADCLIFRKVFDQFYFIWFFFFFEIFDCFISRLCKLLDREILFYDLFHLFLNLFQIICCKRCLSVYIIVKSVCNRWSDRQFCLRI